MKCFPLLREKHKVLGLAKQSVPLLLWEKNVWQKKNKKKPVSYRDGSLFQARSCILRQRCHCCVYLAVVLSIWWPQLGWSYIMNRVWGANTENNSKVSLSTPQKAQYFSHERAFCISCSSTLYHAVLMRWLYTVAWDIVLIQTGVHVCVCACAWVLREAFGPNWHRHVKCSREPSWHPPVRQNSRSRRKRRPAHECE